MGIRMMGWLEQDHLIAADAGPPVGQRACSLGVDRDRRASAVEHDEVVAEAVHLEERDLAHGRQLIWRSGHRCPTPAAPPCNVPPSPQTGRPFVVRPRRKTTNFAAAQPSTAAAEPKIGIVSDT